MMKRNALLKRSGLWSVGVGLLSLSLAACDTASLVELNDPDMVTGPVARDPENINELRNGATYEFARAVTGPAANNANPGIVGFVGVMTDELWYASTFPTMREVDRRDITDTNGGVTTIYQYIHRARNMADQVAAQYAEIGDPKYDEDHAMVTNLAGFSIVFLAENFCSGVPMSSTSLTGELVYGEPQTTAQLVDSAIVRFDAAIAKAQAAGSEEQEFVARIGKARALMIEGDFAGAAAEVASIPTDFNYDVVYSPNSSGQNNGVWYNINSERRSSAATEEGLNGIKFFHFDEDDPEEADPVIDPRIKVEYTGFGIGTQLPHFAQSKYDGRGAGVPLASGLEARLIEAEHALDKGNNAAYLTILNDLRADIGLPALADPGNAEARVKQFFEERARWLWLTGHRLGDLRRMVRHYGFQANSVFPTGQTIAGEPYGNDVNFPIPFQEQNNPNYTGQCIDRNA